MEACQGQEKGIHKVAFFKVTRLHKQALPSGLECKKCFSRTSCTQLRCPLCKGQDSRSSFQGCLKSKGQVQGHRHGTTPYFKHDGKRFSLASKSKWWPSKVWLSHWTKVKVSPMKASEPKSSHSSRLVLETVSLEWKYPKYTGNDCTCCVTYLRNFFSSFSCWNVFFFKTVSFLPIFVYMHIFRSC